MRLKYQLFIALLLCGVTLIALITAINSWSFDRGFSRFMVDSERRRLAPVVEELAQRYRENNGWGWIESRPELLDELRAQGTFSRRRGTDAPARGSSRARALMLVNADRKPLVVDRHSPGRSPRNMGWEPITVDSKVVGYLGIREPRGIPDGIANAFIRQQLRTNVLAAIAMVIVSALLSIALAARLVEPVIRINDAVGKISGGNYRHQIKNDSRNELGNLSRKINQLAMTLDRNQSARQQWSAEISHELRTPVAVLQAEIEAMQDGVKPMDRHAVDSLHAETTRLSGLISDLHTLSLSDIGALDYHMGPVALDELVRQRLGAADRQIEQANLSVSIECQADINTCTLHGDKKRLGQLIDNLVQNSIRYTDAGGCIAVALKTHQSSGLLMLELSWRDSKPGVTDAQRAHLFDPLYRTDDSRTRATGGAGLGLAIVKKIADAHHAVLSAHKAPQGGLEVRLNFPTESTG